MTAVMKRRIALPAAVLVTLVVSGCGSSPPSASSPGTATSSAAGYALTPDGSTAPAGLPQRSTTATTSPQANGHDLPIEVTARYANQGALNAAWWKTLPTSVGPPGIPDGADCLHAGSWLRAHGAVDRGWSWVTLSIRARKPTHIMVLSVRAHILAAHPAAPAPTLLCIPNAGSYLEHEPSEEWPGYAYDGAFVIDGLTNSVHSFIDINTAQYGGQDLKFGETDQRLLTAFAHGCDCMWRLEVEALVDGMRQRWLLNDEDSQSPFRTIAPPRSTKDPTIAVWCAPYGHGRLMTPERGDCQLP